MIITVNIYHQALSEFMIKTKTCKQAKKINSSQSKVFIIFQDLILHLHPK